MEFSEIFSHLPNKVLVKLMQEHLEILSKQDDIKDEDVISVFIFIKGKMENHFKANIENADKMIEFAKTLKSTDDVNEKVKEFLNKP